MKTHFRIKSINYERFATTFFIYSKKNHQMRLEARNNYLEVIEILHNLKVPIFIEDSDVLSFTNKVEKIRLHAELNVITIKHSWHSPDVRYIKNQIKNNDFKVLHRI